MLPGTRRLPALALLLLLAPAPPARAQRVAPPPASLRVEVPSPHAPAPAPRLPQEAREPSTGTMLMGGLAFGALGMLAGGFLGYHLQTWTSCESYEEFCGVGGAVGGAVAREVTMLPLGVHLANGRRGDYIPSLGWSLGIAAAGVTVASLAPESAGPVLLAVPAVQLLAVAAAERRTTRRRERSR